MFGLVSAGIRGRRVWMSSKPTLQSAAVWGGVTVAQHQEVPTLLRDGKPWFGLGVYRPFVSDHYEIFERLGEAGASFMQCDATCSEDIYHPELRFWHADARFDGSFQDAHFRKTLSGNPDALLLLRVFVGAPEWWLDAHPDDLQVYADGSTLCELQRAGLRRLPSLASPRWRADACRALRYYLSWLVESGWSKRVGGILISYGITWEWAILGTDRFPDYSVHGTEFFRDWLLKKYGDDQALSIAWGRPCSLKTACIPSRERRERAGGEDGLRSVPNEQDIIDHQRSLSAMNAELLLLLADTAKEVSGGQLMVGAFYGYTLTAREQTPFSGLYGAGGFLGGHHALGRVLRSLSIDFLSSPYAYHNRSLRDGILMGHGPLASVRRHGKAWIDENDNWTFCNPPQFEAGATALDVGFGADLNETIQMLRWAFGLALVRGKHLWLAELTGWIGGFRENFNNPQIVTEIRRLNAVSEPLMHLARTQKPQIAFILDEQSIACQTLDHRRFESAVYRASPAWMRLGCAVDILLLEDLLEMESSPYRLVIPAGVHCPSSIKALSDWQTNHTETAFLWQAQPGWYPPSNLSAIRRAATEAGVHFFTPKGDCAWENQRMLLVQRSTNSQSPIRLPQPQRGREVFSGRLIEQASSAIPWGFAAGVALFVWD